MPTIIIFCSHGVGFTHLHAGNINFILTQDRANLTTMPGYPHAELRAANLPDQYLL
jgi:hypothetical protein